MMPPTLLMNRAKVYRRSDTGRDSLNNPTYGAPTDGAGWTLIYQDLQCRFAFSSKIVRFAQEGERVLPTGVMYYNPGVTIQPEDRIITEEGVEYNVLSVQPASTFGSAVDHYEAVLQLP